VEKIVVVFCKKKAIKGHKFENELFFPKAARVSWDKKASTKV